MTTSPGIPARTEARVANRSGEEVTLGAPSFGAVAEAEQVLVDGSPAEDAVRVGPGQAVTFTVTLAPQDSVDFLVVTPVIPVQRADGTVVETYLPEANLGMIDVSPADVAAIAQR